MSQEPIKSWRKGGTKEFGTWVLGERVRDIKDVKVGDILLFESQQFDALNMLRVDEFPGPAATVGTRVYGVFVNPLDVSQKRAPNDGTICVWNHEFESDNRFADRYFRVSQPQGAL